MRHGVVYDRGPSATSLVAHRPCITNPGNDKTVTDSRHLLRIAREPRNGPDCAGDEQQPVGVPHITATEECPEVEDEGDPGQVVVAQGRVADVAREKHLARLPPGDDALAVCQRTVLKGGVDEDLILPVLQAEKPG